MDANLAEIEEALIIDWAREYMSPLQRLPRPEWLVLWDKEGRWWSLFPEPAGVTCDQCERRSFILAACFPLARLCLCCWGERNR